MILCAGLTPAWQQAMVFDAFRTGEVNRAREVRWSASGKVFNAGLGVHTLGGRARVLATVGGPPLAEIEREFAALGCPHRWIATRSATRVCTTLLDQAAGTITELVENGRPLEADELEAFRRAYAEEAARAERVILIGSLPEGTPQPFYRELLDATPCPAILDFRGEGLLECLACRPLLVKPNREELARTLGRPLASDAELLDGMRELNRRGAQWVLVTHGGEALWLTSARETLRFTPPRVDRVVNPIGSGDALAAGVAVALEEGRPMPEAVRFGVACAAENVRHLLACRLDRREAERWLDEIEMQTRH